MNSANSAGARLVVAMLFGAGALFVAPGKALSADLVLQCKITEEDNTGAGVDDVVLITVDQARLAVEISEGPRRLSIDWLDNRKRRNGDTEIVDEVRVSSSQIRATKEDWFVWEGKRDERNSTAELRISRVTGEFEFKFSGIDQTIGKTTVTWVKPYYAKGKCEPAETKKKF